MPTLTRRTSLVVLLLAVWAATAAAQDRRPLSDQETLTRLERDWDEAFYRNDVPFISNILAPEFVAIYEDGATGDRDKELKEAAEFNQQHVASQLSDVIVKIYGDTAVVRMTRTLTGTRGGQPASDAFRFLDIFTYRDGRWQCVATQSTKVTP